VARVPLVPSTPRSNHSAAQKQTARPHHPCLQACRAARGRAAQPQRPQHASHRHPLLLKNKTPAPTTRACRRAVPLAIALLNPSAPSMPAVDTLSRLTHDADSEVAQSAVLGLGIIGAGGYG